MRRRDLIMSAADEIKTWLAHELKDPSTSWSTGTFGAIAEFVRDPGEAAYLHTGGETLSVETELGGIRFERFADVRPVAYETLSANPGQWNQAVALCLNIGDCAMSARTALTELGPDKAALRDRDRDAILFDLGLGILQADICVRSGNADLIAALRAAEGQPVFAPGNLAMGAILKHGPHRVFMTRLGRAEVYQPIPAPGGRSPKGPHTHVLPKLLRSGQTHAATNPIPDGLVPCAHLYPAHPTKGVDGRPRPFDAGLHGRFQMVLAKYGDPKLFALKERARQAVLRGLDAANFEVPSSKFSRAGIRVVLRQMGASGEATHSLSSWSALFDHRAFPSDEDDEQSEHRLTRR
jgi:hypothetical protein